jgi:hypothetical protein
MSECVKEAGNAILTDPEKINHPVTFVKSLLRTIIMSIVICLLYILTIIYVFFFVFPGKVQARCILPEDILDCPAGGPFREANKASDVSIPVTQFCMTDLDNVPSSPVTGRDGPR